MIASFGFRKRLMMLFGPLLLAVITGCANVAAVKMVPESFDLLMHFNKTVHVVVDTAKASSHFKHMVEDAEFKNAIEQSLRKAKLFEDVKASGGSDYQLRVTVTSVGNFWGLDARVAVNTTWEVIDLQRQAPVWKDVVLSEFTATIGDALGGAKRVKLAYEGVLKDNIRKGINQLSSSM
jgi:hypothetical protein